MKEYIKISNDGEIDLNAFFLIGASTKRGNDNKIGFFGSGLKYGLAVLLRNHIEVKIFKGVKEITLSTKKKKFREQTFNQIHVNNKPTGLTLEMGIDWDVWYAVREIYSNALDEKNPSMSIVNEENAIPDFDKTIFYIEVTGTIQACLDNWDEYFSEKRKDIIFYNDDLKVFTGGEDNIIYRKGIQCHKARLKSLFHYDLKDIEINESRTLKHSCDNTWRVAEVVMKNANKEIIKTIYDNQITDDFFIEHLFRWEYSRFNEDWLNVIGGRRLVIKEVSGHYTEEIIKGDVLILQKSLVDALARQFKNRVKVVGRSDKFGDSNVIKKTERQKLYISEATDFLKSNGYDIPYSIEVAVFEDKEQMGEASGNVILIADEAFDKGKKMVCSTIFEEYIHIKYRYSDCSRSMQNFLFDKIITMLEEKSEIYF